MNEKVLTTDQITPRPSDYETVERIRRTHRSAQPNPAENPAWANAHRDCGVLLAEIERLQKLYESAVRGRAEFRKLVREMRDRIEAIP